MELTNGRFDGEEWFTKELGALNPLQSEMVIPELPNKRESVTTIF